MDERISYRNFTVLIGIGAITGVAAILRFYELGRRDFWFDESCTYIYISKLWHWPEGWRGLLRESTNLPYYQLLWAWSKVFGDSQAALRAMSALVGALTIPVLATIAYQIRGRIAAIVCAILAATNPIHIHYSREARAYALWMLTLSLATWLLIEAARRKSWNWWIAFGLATFFNLHLHYWTFFWIPASAAILFLSDARRVTMKRWLVTMCGTLVAFIPYVVLAVIPAARGGGNLWIEPHFDAWSAIPRSLWAMLPAGEYPAHLRGLSLQSPDTMTHLSEPATRLAPIICLVVILALVMLTLMRFVRSKQIFAHAFAASITISPLILALGYSLFVRPNYLVGRYDLVAWPGAMLWLTLLVVDALASPLNKGGSRGVVSVAPAAAIAITLLMTACAFIPLERELFGETRPSLAHQRAKRIAELTAPGDLVIAFSYDRDYLLYDLHRAGFRGQIRSFPTWLENQVGWIDTSSDLSPDRRTALQESAESLAHEAQAVLSRGEKVFILADSADATNEGPRAQIDGALLEKLRGKGCETQLANADMRIYLLTCERQ